MSGRKRKASNKDGGGKAKKARVDAETRLVEMEKRLEKLESKGGSGAGAGAGSGSGAGAGSGSGSIDLSCLICSDGQKDDDYLLVPCKCSSLVHQKCLDKWRSESKSSSCEVCQTKYKVEKKDENEAKKTVFHCQLNECGRMYDSRGERDRHMMMAHKFNMCRNCGNTVPEQLRKGRCDKCYNHPCSCDRASDSCWGCREV